MRVRARCEVATDGREAAPYYWSQTMSAGMHESHHQLNPVAKLLGMASGKKKSVLVLRASRGNGWTDEGMERGMSALAAFVHTKTSLYAHIRSSLHLRLAINRRRHLG